MNVGKRHRVTVRRKCSHHRGITQRVDQSRHATGVAIDLRESLFRKDLAITATCNFEAMLNVGSHLLRRQRGQMESQTDALRELNELRRIQFLIELRLSGENDAKHL